MTSTCQFTCCLLLQVLLWLPNAGADLHLFVNPTEAVIGLTEALEINCTISPKVDSSITSVLSLVLSRGGKQDDNVTDLATITLFSEHNVNKLTVEDVEAVGVISPAGESYLNLRYEYPTSNHAGVYKCAAHGFNEDGLIAVTADVAWVKVTQPDAEDITDKIKEMEIYMEDMSQKMVAVETEMRSGERNVAELGINTKNLEKRVSVLEEQMALLTDQISPKLSERFEDPLTYNNHKYYISKHPFHGMENAVANCTLLDGYVVEIDDSLEYQAIQRFVRNASGVNQVVIAGSDEEQEGTWILPSTKQPLPVLDFRSDQPNGGSTENCLDLCEHSPLWQMCDLGCQYGPFHSVRYMCEVPQI